MHPPEEDPTELCLNLGSFSESALTQVDESSGNGIHLLTKNLVTQSLETFYFAANLILTRPEVIWAHVYTSFVTAFQMRNAAGQILNDKSLNEAKRTLFFDVTRGADVEEHFLGPSEVSTVELQRVWILDSKSYIEVTMREIWDFDKKQIRFGPKTRKKSRAEEAEFNNLIPLATFNLMYAPGEVTLTAVGIHPDDLQSEPDTFSREIDKISKIFQENSLEVWRGNGRQFTSHPTLLHVDRQNYLREYHKLKKAQSLLLKQMWEKLEVSTNAEKFIAEDLHIAVYLDRLQANPTGPIKFEKKFVDIGCGNGLLSYLLTQMGWEGYGVDLRRRSLWDEFQKANTELQESQVAYNTVFPTVGSNTLLIGNHPDELACLIPFLAAKYRAAGFIVIPCCAYDIFGRKLLRENSKRSVFDNHIRALIKWSNDLGFQTYVDKLRIPSTKRIAILGSTPLTWTSENTAVFDSHWNIFENTTKAPPLQAKVPPSKPSLSGAVISSIVDTIFAFILRGYHCRGQGGTENTCEPCIKKNNACSSYNAGCQRLTIPMLVDHLSDYHLKSMKTLHGNGLLTVLRSFPDTFKIVNGYVHILVPHESRLEKLIQDGKENLAGTKRCVWFDCHPDGCPLQASQCAYAHSKSK